MGKPGQPENIMESVLAWQEQDSTKKQQRVSDTPWSALIPGLMELSIVAPEPVVQPGWKVQTSRWTPSKI